MALNLENFYWNSNGRYQSVVAALTELIPMEGTVKNPYKNKALERFRKASNRYYRLYNDGDFGIGSAKMFGVDSPSQYRGYNHYTDHRGRTQRSLTWRQGLYDAVEAAMDNIILAAAAEQNIKL